MCRATAAANTCVVALPPRSWVWFSAPARVALTAPSIMSGFQSEFHKRIRGTLADITVFSGRPFGIRENPLLERRLYLLESNGGDE